MPAVWSTMGAMPLTSTGSRGLRPLARLVAIASVGWAAACSSYGASEALAPTTGDASTNEPLEAGNGAGEERDAGDDDADGGARDAGADNDASDATCAQPTSAPLMYAVADALLNESDTSGRYGSLSVCNMAFGRCVLRFQLTTDAAAAIKAGRVSRLTLKLHRAKSHDSACGTGKDCTTDAYRQAATLFVAPMRNDWEESNVRWARRAGLDYVGATWGAPGASRIGTDVGDLAGQQGVTVDETSATVDLAPGTFGDAFVDVSKNPPELSLRTEFLQASTRRAFVAVMHESTGGVAPVQPPELSLTYCPSM